MSQSEDIDELELLAFRFFKLFAQYESAIKGQPLVKRSGVDGFKVDWDRVANERIGREFLNLLGSKRKFALYLLDNPPQKQVLKNDDSVGWREVSTTDQTVQALFGHICRVRNNLFHGAKFDGNFSNEWAFEETRIRDLLTASLEVLEHFKEKIHLRT